MIFCRHIPAEPLARYVDWFWFFEDLHPLHRREHVLPDGTFELIINLREEPRKLFDRLKPERETVFRRGWVSGTHSEYIVIDALPDSSMMGVHFKAGGAPAFLGLPADELRDQVVQLDAIWGSSAAELREQLLATPGPRLKFRILERFLLGLLARRLPDPAQERKVFWALHRFSENTEISSVANVVHELGMSHKHFIHRFRREVGLTPKLFCRIQRFQQVLSQLTRRRTVEWAEVAHGCGYFDQAHFVHDFQAFSGLNPSAYRSRGALEYPNFVPVDEAR